MNSRPFRFFLGGRDLEMVTIRELVEAELGAKAVVDDRLRWGARASHHAGRIEVALAGGLRPVLVELADDLPEDFPRQELVVVDHHGARAGAAAPSALRQVFELLGLEESRWTRWLELVAANDVGHIRALRAAGAGAAEIRAIRDADRAAQGVSARAEDEARRALAENERRGDLVIVRPRLDGTTSAVGDFIEPEYGGPGADALLVLHPGGADFFGPGDRVQALHHRFGGWCGGALPERGFWGSDDPDVDFQAVIATAAR